MDELSVLRQRAAELAAPIAEPAPRSVRDVDLEKILTRIEQTQLPRILLIGAEDGDRLYLDVRAGRIQQMRFGLREKEWVAADAQEFREAIVHAIGRVFQTVAAVALHWTYANESICVNPGVGLSVQMLSDWLSDAGKSVDPGVVIERLTFRITELGGAAINCSDGIQDEGVGDPALLARLSRLPTAWLEDRWTNELSGGRVQNECTSLVIALAEEQPAALMLIRIADAKLVALLNKKAALDLQMEWIPKLPT